MDFLFAKTRSLKARYFKKIIYFSSLWTDWQLFIQPPDTSIQHSCETYKLDKVKINNQRFLLILKVNVHKSSTTEQ
jgi:hypothetical protein